MNNAGSLRANTKGATLLLGLFMAVFLVGLLYHVISIGHSITYKEKLQDVADTSAFTAAASHARSMNLIGLMNLTQLTGVAVLLTLDMSEWETENCINHPRNYSYPWVLCPGLNAKIRPASEWAKQHWLPLLSTITSAAEAVRDSTPQLAQREVDTVGKVAAPAVISAGIVPRALPLVRADLEVLCAKAFMFVTPLARNAGLGPLIDHPAIDMPAEIVARYLASSQHCQSLGSAGPLVMDPPNQSGTEPLQIRTFAIGNPEILPWGNQVVRLPLETIARPSGSTRTWVNDRSDYLDLSSFALAQAEYYSTWFLVNLLDGDIPTNIPEENTFYMHWQARLRRLRVPLNVDTNVISADNAFRQWVQQALLPACLSHCTSANCGNRCAFLSGFGSLGNISFH